MAAASSIARLTPLIAAVDLLRETYPDMTLNQVIVLLLIAANPGITQREIMERTGLSDASASRIVGLLSEFGNRGTGPFHLIELIPSQEDRRIKMLHLTKKGRQLVDGLLDMFKR